MRASAADRSSAPAVSLEGLVRRYGDVIILSVIPVYLAQRIGEETAAVTR
jgi:hypothetical protein